MSFMTMDSNLGNNETNPNGQEKKKQKAGFSQRQREVRHMGDASFIHE
jgi:hypothetical protein